MKKYGIVIQTEVRREYGPLMGWDYLYATRKEAMEVAKRAIDLWENARVYEIEVPAEVDHLHRRVHMEDHGYLYA